MKVAFNDFSGGWNTELEPSKLPENAYRLLVNGRAKNNVISPVLDDAEITLPTTGKVQKLFSTGNAMYVFVDGLAYCAPVTASGPLEWASVVGWSLMSTTADEFYAIAVPAATSSLQFSSSTDVTARQATFNSALSRTPECIIVQDGLSQPQLLFPSGSARLAKTYDEWTVDAPEYVPVGKFMALSGVKLYIAAPDGLSYYQSVSGRPLDFVVNRTETAKGGDASTTSGAVSFQPLTGLYGLSDGGLLATTISATFRVALDYAFPIFNEPFLQTSSLFPVGVVGQQAAADVYGDFALIAPHGIQSFNETQATQARSNNFPFSADIASVFFGITQSQALLVDLPDEVLFAMDTKYGHVILVYDKIRKHFTGYDEPRGRIKQFVYCLQPGFLRVFYITTDNKMYEYRGGTTNRTVQFTPRDVVFAPDETHSLVNISMAFSENTEMELTVTRDADSTEVFQSTGKLLRCTPTSRVPNWRSVFSMRFNGTLVGAVAEYVPDTFRTSGYLAVPTAEPPVYLFTADMGGAVQYGVAMSEVALVEGEFYSLRGELLLGGVLLENTTFIATSSVGYLTGAVMKISHFSPMLEEKPTAYVFGGDLAYGYAGSFTDGSQDSHDLTLQAFKNATTILAAGNHDLDNTLGVPIFRRTPGRYYQTGVLAGNIEFFIFNPGWNTAGTATEPDGFSSTSTQANRLREAIRLSTARHKIVVSHFPAVTDSASHSPGRTELSWLSADALGVAAVLNGHSHLYERFSDRHIVCGLGGHSFVSFAAGTSRSLVRFEGTAGYLLLRPYLHSLGVEFKTVDGVVRDSITY